MGETIMRTVLRNVAVAVLGVVPVVGCQSTNVTPIAADTVFIRTATAPIYGPNGATNVAFQRAACETLARGFDRYVIAGISTGSSSRVVGRTPIYTTGNATATRVGSTTYVSGGAQTFGGTPIVASRNEAGITVRMFRASDPAGANALDARAQATSC